MSKDVLSILKKRRKIELGVKTRRLDVWWRSDKGQHSESHSWLGYVALLIATFGFLLKSCLANPLVFATAYPVRDDEMFLADLTSLAFGDGLSLRILQLVRAVFSQDGVYAVEQMGGTGTDGLIMVFATIDHLVVVDSGDLRVIAASYIGIQESGGLDQIGASLSNVQTFGFSETALTAVGYQSTPTSELSQGRKAQDIADESDVNSSAVLPDTLEGFQVALGVKLAIERAQNLEFEVMGLSMGLLKAQLLPVDIFLQKSVIQAGTAVEINHELGLFEDPRDPGCFSIPVRKSLLPSSSQGLWADF